MSLNKIENYYFNQSESTRACLLALRTVILGYDRSISEEWKYNLPFFYLNKKPFIYLWKDSKTGCPYIGIWKGNLIYHDSLIQGNRKQMKVLYLNPEEDLPLGIIYEILGLAKKFY